LKYVHNSDNDGNVSDDVDVVEEDKEEFTNRGKGLGH
jgi:hypothetical protein